MVWVAIGWGIWVNLVHFLINPIIMAIIAQSLGWSGETGRYFSHVNIGAAVYGRYYKESRTQWIYRLLLLIWTAIFIGAPFFTKGQIFFTETAQFALLWGVKAVRAAYDALSPILN